MKISVNKSAKRGICRVIFDEFKCDRPQWKMGLCAKCFKRLERLGLETSGFKEPGRGIVNGEQSTEVSKKYSRLGGNSDFWCHILEYAKPCKNPVYMRGLCEKHFEYFERIGKLEEFGNPITKSLNDRLRMHQLEFGDES